MAPRCAGTAMTEFALALPLLAVVLALLWFVGWSHMRKQRVVVANRHAVWRSIAGDTLDDQAVDEDLLSGAPISVNQERIYGHWQDLADWVAAGAEVSDAAATLADETVIERWPKELVIRLEARYEPPLAIGRDFGNDLSFRHGRAGFEWIRGQAGEGGALRELYYEDLDAALRSVAEPGESMARRVRGLYLESW
jgi:hypothetical protein